MENRPSARNAGKPSTQRKIVRIDRSPMNPKVWIAQLDCGHDNYVYRKPRKDKQTMECEKCPR